MESKVRELYEFDYGTYIKELRQDKDNRRRNDSRFVDVWQVLGDGRRDQLREIPGVAEYYDCKFPELK
ncbi:hypothetical protein HNV12_00410 [Methanococcoides sp. SA1]|nr:hypothetical protein [Methanococcoides sp. SA1]